MDVRDELHEALDEKDFPNPALLAQTMARLDEPKPSRTYKWPASLVAGILAVALVTTFLMVRANHQAKAPSIPPLQVASSISGFVSYQFVSPQVGWLLVFTPAGQTVVAATTDGGKTWQRQLELSGLSPIATIQFVNAHDGVVMGVLNGKTSTVWRTVDGGGHWEDYQLPSDAGLLATGYFFDTLHGWVLTTGSNRGSVPNTSGLVYRTANGGQTWQRVGRLDATPALLGQIRFASPTDGVITTFRTTPGISVYVTHDGGRTWASQELPAPTTSSASFVTIEPPVFFSNVGLLLVTFFRPTAQECPTPSPAPASTPKVCHTYQPTSQFLYETSDDGITWSGPQQILVRGNLDFVGRRTWIVLTSDGLSVTNDAGKRWSSPRPLPVPSGWYGSRAQFLDADRGWVALSDSSASKVVALGGRDIEGTPPKFALLVTDDGGVTWHEVSLPGL